MPIQRIESFLLGGLLQGTFPRSVLVGVPGYVVSKYHITAENSAESIQDSYLATP